MKNILVLKSILRCSELASSLNVNFHKNKLSEIGLEHFTIHRFYKILNCCIMKIPFVYLGILVGGNHKSKYFWQGIIVKLKEKLSK